MSEAPIERVRSELFNAGSDWQQELASPAVAAFAAALTRLYVELPERLARSERADSVLAAAVAEARHASMEVGFSGASALAERAFARLLLGTTQGATDDPAAVGTRWEAARGSAGDLVARYVGEIFGQYARHVTDREAGRLVGENIGAAASSRLSDDLAERAASIGRSVAAEVLQGGTDVAASWSQVVNRAFDVGRSLPRSDS
jgi:hypothetical protein